jgi:hypothetical protein
MLAVVTHLSVDGIVGIGTPRSVARWHWGPRGYRYGERAVDHDTYLESVVNNQVPSIRDSRLRLIGAFFFLHLRCNM